jgi:hypothetical protein
MLPNSSAVKSNQKLDGYSSNPVYHNGPNGPVWMIPPGATAGDCVQPPPVPPSSPWLSSSSNNLATTNNERNYDKDCRTNQSVMHLGLGLSVEASSNVECKEEMDISQSFIHSDLLLCNDGDSGDQSSLPTAFISSLPESALMLPTPPQEKQGLSPQLSGDCYPPIASPPIGVSVKSKLMYFNGRHTPPNPSFLETILEEETHL